ncbi:MAG: hypothetical protein IPI42_08450 [Saprospiraceae bacterium]|nr:hypothetical protein [Candidatus Parvibacillus calidus]
MKIFLKLNTKVSIPMKCFCDIPLGMIKKHLSNYSKFRIGITKEYAKKNTFSPCNLHSRKF